MKKSFKIAIATVLILLTGTAGALYYFLNMKEYDVADEKVEEITKNDYKVDLPDLDSIVDGEESGDADSKAAGGDAAAAGTESADSTSDSSTATASGDSGNSDTKGNSNTKVTTGTGGSKSGNSSSKAAEGKKKDAAAKKQPEKKITAEMIKAAYRPSFEDLQVQANAKIDSLVGAAYSEYSTKKQNGESISITYFYRKYTSAGQALEANTDETFNYLYGGLVSDLKARGFSASEAKEFKTQYESAKEARQSALLEKAKSAL